MAVANLLQRGADWLEQMRTKHCSSVVEYHRPPTLVAALMVNATFGRTEVQIEDEAGITTTAHVWDFLILADELTSLPGEIGPEPGDVIIANDRQYEVMALGEDIRGWRWSDSFRQTYRIHTKDIGAAA